MPLYSGYDANEKAEAEDGEGMAWSMEMQGDEPAVQRYGEAERVGRGVEAGADEEAQESLLRGGAEGIFVAHRSDGSPRKGRRGAHSRSTRRCCVIVVPAALLLTLLLALLSNSNRSAQAAKPAVEIEAEGSANATSFSPIDALVDPSVFQLGASGSEWDVSQAVRTRTYDWTISEVIAAPAGVSKRMLVVNGHSPGPTIEANVGDRIVVRVENRMMNGTAIHWHGQPLSGAGQNYMDGTSGVSQCPIPPGASFTYEWTVRTSGTYWWHAHFEGQYSDGLYGALILHDPKDHLQLIHAGSRAKEEMPSESALIAQQSRYHHDRVILMSDIWNDLSGAYLEGYMSFEGPPGGVQGDEPVPDCGIVNGIGHCAGGLQHSPASLPVLPDKTYRLRLLNVGSLAEIRFEIEGHSLIVVEADGTEVVPHSVKSITLAVAQRYSVLVQMDRGAERQRKWRIKADLSDSMFGYEPEHLIKEQAMVLQYEQPVKHDEPEGSTASLPVPDHQIDQSLDPSALVPLIPIAAPNKVDRQETLLVSFGLTSSSVYRAFFNETSWEMPPANGSSVMALRKQKPYPDQLVFKNDQTIVMDLIINNEDEGDHPMHIHVSNTSGFTLTTRKV
ncbi:hypothetical protein IE81DRAFT_227623 [Ceraceosorus guamensis]|uniref:Multicopper oxidase n=1 Tax=Ceraceosorus guamensis TaxID=1522189 RepID=A0A316W7F1_9BASI|nr:hypothetical protein IE81DRAFT_227623 [Ceraceosorus guamensis]PWN45058.1 hypothetical protein IE81DRAFT_227623 [Ceraceosorus guamensis]